MVDRNAVLVAPKKPFFAWLNHLNPNDPIKESQIKDHNIYLIHEVGTEAEFEQWLTLHYNRLFEEELFQWHTHTEDWPTNRTLALFKKWFRVQQHSMVYDFEKDALTKDEQEAVKIFKVVDGHYPLHQSNELGYADSILAAASSKGILHKSAYRSCAHVAPTSNIVEHLFGACKRTMTDYRRVMDPSTLDTLMVMRSNSDLWLRDA
jgi:hypothetical protein